jgi:hypothetical protein
LTGLVEADLYKDNFINFPARWRDLSFSGVLAKGTPVAQCIPVKREFWSAQFATITGGASIAGSSGCRNGSNCARVLGIDLARSPPQDRSGSAQDFISDFRLASVFS